VDEEVRNKESKAQAKNDVRINQVSSRITEKAEG
jgi:hypothetical protein